MVERGGRIGERGPVADRLRERVCLLVGDLVTEIGGEPAQRAGDDLAVAQVGPSLELRLVSRVELE